MYNLQTVRSVAWGLTHEKVAIQAYCDLGAQVTETGKENIMAHLLKQAVYPRKTRILHSLNLKKEII